MILNDKIYNILKWVSTIVLPAIGTLYFTIAGIWGLPYAEQVLGTITALVTFCGVVLGVSTHSYNKDPNSGDGILMIDTNDPEKDRYLLNLRTDLDEVARKSRLIVKVDTDADLSDKNV